MTHEDWTWVRSINLDGVVNGCAVFGPAALLADPGDGSRLHVEGDDAVARQGGVHLTVELQVGPGQECPRGRVAAERGRVELVAGGPIDDFLRHDQVAHLELGAHASGDP